MKILYASQNNPSSKIQLARFLQAMQGKMHTIKVAAFKKSSPENIPIDWTLDCLQDIFKPDIISCNNDNYEIYFNQVKKYNPDLIISDMEYYTSQIAIDLNITLWQCSSALINFGLTNDYKYNLGAFKKYSFLLSKKSIENQRLLNIQDNSDKNYIYSHFGDCSNKPKIKSNYDWIKPYHQLGKISATCGHNIIGNMIGSNKKLLDLLCRYQDSICFTDFPHENYMSVIIKNIDNQEEYFCNIKNSDYFACSGETSFLADAYYNNKYSIVLTDLNNSECIMNSIISEKLQLSSSVYNSNENLDLSKCPNINSNSNNKFLHEKIEEF